MARKTAYTQDQSHDFNIERFQGRLYAKFCIIFVAVTQIIFRVLTVLLDSELNPRTKIVNYVSIPLFFLLALIICTEYILYKKIGPKIMNYAKHIDMLLLLIFTGEWMATLMISISRISDAGIALHQLDAVFSFTSFGWRTIFLLFMIQNWRLIVIPPAAALCITIGYVLHFKPGGTIFTLMIGGPQVFYVIMMLYFQDRIKWKEVFTNVQQERWMKINDFILNNIPENIIIMELGGSVKLVSDYCKSFMRKVHVSLDPKDLFFNIKDLYQQPESEPSSPSSTFRQTERLLSMNGFLEPTGQNLPNYQKIDSLEELIRDFKGIIKENNLQERQFLIYNGKLNVEGHKTKSIEVKISYIQQYGQEYMVLIIRDTTQRDLLLTLEDNNKYKDQLLASVSHELRAPLNGNINLVESAVGNNKVPEEIKEKLLVPALRSSKFLLHLINDILDMSQIKAQKLRLIFKAKKLQETLKDALQLIELQAKRKGIDLTLAVHPEVQENILCTDHVRLSQIVLNLLNNAIKFTQKGSIILSAVPMDDPNCIKISVQDSGIGMNKEDIKKLFSDYTHIEFADRASINPTGVGLGLSIAYNLAKLLGPNIQKGITVESVLGIGSTFSFIIENKEEEQQLEIQDMLVKNPSDKSQPVPEEYLFTESPNLYNRLHKSFSANFITHTNQKFSPLLMMDSERRPMEPCKCPKILVVDDNPFNTMAFETVLASLGFKCDSVFDGKAAIDKILYRQNNRCRGENCKPYEVIFMDQEMPGMTGSETVGELKKLQMQYLVPEMKIIGCTAHGSDEEVVRFMGSGIDQCIHKPINPGEIQKILDEIEGLEE